MCGVQHGEMHVVYDVCMYDYIAVSTRTLTPPTTGTDVGASPPGGEGGGVHDWVGRCARGTAVDTVAIPGCMWEQGGRGGGVFARGVWGGGFT